MFFEYSEIVALPVLQVKHGRGHGYYQPDDCHRSERKPHSKIKTEGVEKEACKYHGPDARHSTEECHKKPANMKAAANKKTCT